MITVENAIEIIESKRQLDKEKVIKKFDEEPELQVLRGPYGPYISFKKKNYRISKREDPAKLSLEECKKIINQASSRKKKTQGKK